MIKKIILMGTLFITSIVLIACGDVNDTDQSGQANEEDTENVESSEPVESEGALSLGDTASVESTLGEYDITVHSFEIHNEFEGEDPMNDIMVLVDYTITNTDDEPLEANDLYNGTLFTPEEHGLSSGNSFAFDSIVAEGAIEPGESKDDQFLFQHEETEDFELVHNFSLPGTEVTWLFSADEASN